MSDQTAASPAAHATHPELLAATIHRRARRSKEDGPFAREARCGSAWFEGGYVEMMRVTDAADEVTCAECRLTTAGAWVRMARIYTLVALLLIVDSFGNLLMYARGRRAPDSSRPRMDGAGTERVGKRS